MYIRDFRRDANERDPLSVPEVVHRARGPARAGGQGPGDPSRLPRPPDPPAPSSGRGQGVGRPRPGEAMAREVSSPPSSPDGARRPWCRPPTSTGRPPRPERVAGRASRVTATPTLTGSDPGTGVRVIEVEPRGAPPSTKEVRNYLIARFVLFEGVESVSLHVPGPSPWPSAAPWHGRSRRFNWVRKPFSGRPDKGAGATRTKTCCQALCPTPQGLPHPANTQRGNPLTAGPDVKEKRQVRAIK